MAFELVYTSVPQGIRPGSSGFCIAAYTNGLAANVALQLESLSAYKPYFPHYDANAHRNPVAYSHYLYNSSGETVHILSRTCFYGLDYTKRSNKLAHHIVLTAAELTGAPGGPSTVFRQEGLFRSQWQEPPQLFPQQRRIHAPETACRPAARWAEYTGDAGWAGVLAQAYLDAPEKTAFIIYDPLVHENIPELVEEALLLLPPAIRWGVSFNTYFTNLPAGIRCSWRFCTVGADALREARRTPGTLVIDLTKSLPQAPAGELQEAARTGCLPLVLNIPAAVPGEKAAALQPREPFRKEQREPEAKPFIREEERNRLKLLRLPVAVAGLLLVAAIVLYSFINSSRTDEGNGVEIVSSGGQAEEESGTPPVQSSARTEAETGTDAGKNATPPVPETSRQKVPETAAQTEKTTQTLKPETGQNPREQTDEERIAREKAGLEHAAREKAEQERIVTWNRKTLWMDPELSVLTAGKQYEKQLLLDGEKAVKLHIAEVVNGRRNKEEECAVDENGLAVKARSVGMNPIERFRCTVQSAGSLLKITCEKNERSQYVITAFTVRKEGAEERIDCGYKPDYSVIPDDPDAALTFFVKDHRFSFSYLRTTLDKEAGRKASGTFSTAAILFIFPDGKQLQTEEIRWSGLLGNVSLTGREFIFDTYNKLLATDQDLEAIRKLRADLPELESRIVAHWKKAGEQYENAQKALKDTTLPDEQKAKAEQVIAAYEPFKEDAERLLAGAFREEAEKVPLRLLWIPAGNTKANTAADMNAPLPKSEKLDTRKKELLAACRQEEERVAEEFRRSEVWIIVPPDHKFKRISFAGR